MAVERSFPAFDLYPNDFLGSYKVSKMDATDVGVYFLLLLLDWQEVGFEFDRSSIAKWCRVSPRTLDVVWAKVGPCFIERDGRMYNPRLEIERLKKVEWREKSAKGGRTSAQARLKGGSTTVARVVQAPSPTPSPTPSLQRLTTGADAPCDTTVATPDDTPPVPVGSLYGKLKPLLYGTQGEPDRTHQNSDVNVLKDLRGSGRWRDADILAVVTEVRRQSGAGLLGFIPKGARFGMKTLLTPDPDSGIRLVDRVMTEVRRHAQRTPKPSGLKSVGDLLRTSEAA